MIGFSGCKKLNAHFFDYMKVKMAKTPQHHFFDVTIQCYLCVDFMGIFNLGENKLSSVRN